MNLKCNYLSLITCLLIKISYAFQRPHVILIVADDLGWGDVSFHGSKQIKTPNIDILAQTGITLNNYYVSPICTPSRSALLTGYHPIHTGLQHDVIYGSEPYGVPLNITLMPQYLRNLGYSTVAIGKWHLGFFRNDYTPTKRGFDSHFGYWTGHEDYYDRTSLENWWGIDFRCEAQHCDDIDQYERMYSTEMYTKRAVQAISNHSKTSTNPMFLYLAYQAVHAGNQYQPLQAPQRYVNRFPNIVDQRRRTFAGMVSALDDAIGQIFTALFEANMLNNSIIVFTTDNGAATGGTAGQSIDDSIGSNWPLRGAKYTLWEGGIRGVSFVWSADFEYRYTSNNLIHVQDWLPTIYSAIGGDVRDLGAIDGIDMWHSLRHNSTSQRTQLLHNIDDIWQVWALRYGDYKLISGIMFDGDFDGWFLPPGEQNGTQYRSDRKEFNVINESSSVERVLYNMGINVSHQTGAQTFINCNDSVKSACEPKTMRYCLFNVAIDPCEYNNIVDKETEIVEKMLQLLNEYNNTAIPAGKRPSDPMANPVFHKYRWDVWL